MLRLLFSCFLPMTIIRFQLQFILPWVIKSIINFNIIGIITARQRSCGKVMFSYVSVCFTEVFPLYKVPPRTIQGPPLAPPLPSYIWWPRLETCSNLLTCSPHLTPLILTSGGWSTFGRRAGGTYYTGMFSYNSGTVSVLFIDLCRTN